MGLLGDLDIREAADAINFDRFVRITGFELLVKEEDAKASAKLAQAKAQLADAIIRSLSSGSFEVNGVKVNAAPEHTAGTTETGAL